MKRLCIALCSFCLVAGCGGGGSTPTTPAPTPTVSAVALSLGDVVLTGRTITATATATLSTGQTQAVTSGWTSSATNVATVTDTGTVRGVANGTSLISVSSSGHAASKTIRVAPDYDGAWSGTQTLTGCRDSFEFTGFCREPDVQALIGTMYPVSVTGRHPGALEVSGEFVVEGFRFPTFTTPVEDDGTIRLSGSIDDVDMRLAVRWIKRSDTVGRAGGTIEEVFTFPGLAAGEIIFDSTFTTTRAGAVAIHSAESLGTKTRRLVQQLRARRR